MNNTAMWSLIVGFFLPLVVAFVQQQHWSEPLRAFVGFFASLIAAAGTVLIQLGSWNWHQWIQSSLLIVVTAIATYKGFWKKTGIAPTIEAGTSKGAPRG